MEIAGYTVGLIFLIILVVDIVVIYRDGPKASISAFCIRWAKRYPIFPFVVGIIFGHVFWSMSDFDYMSDEQIKLKCEQYYDQN